MVQEASDGVDEANRENNNQSKFKLRTVVAVEVQDLKNGATHYWSLEKFRFVKKYFKGNFISFNRPSFVITCTLTEPPSFYETK